MTVILGDCLEIMREMPDGSVDVIITDPPYNAINRTTGNLRVIDKGLADSTPIDIPSLSKEFWRITRGSVYTWCSDEQYTDWVNAFKSLGATTRICAWLKTNPSPMNGEKFWLSALELCVFARKSHATFNRFCKPPLWKGPSERVSGFPCPKPLWLMEELISASSNEGDTILDPFMGSGTTMVACERTGRNGIGIELNKDYFEIAQKRLSQLSLFR